MAQTGFEISVASDDRFRGQTVSGDRPIGTATLAYDDVRGLYAGISATVVATRDSVVRPHRSVQYVGYTNETSLTIIARETIALDGPLSEQVGATSGQTWLHLMALRRAAGTSPISFSDIYLHPAFRSLKLDDDVGDVPIFSRIEEQFGERVAEVRQHIEAVAIPAPIAKLLETKTGAPGLRLTRQYLNARGEVVEMAINTHPADRYSYSQTFRRDPVSGL